MRVRSLRVVAGAVLLASAGCASEYHPEYHPESSYTVNQSVSYPTIYQVGDVSNAGPPVVSAAPVAAQPVKRAPPVDPSRVAVVESAQLDRPGEVVAVLDLQDPKGTHDSGVALLRERAAELGADAVVSVEFHHGDGGRATRVSGLAVRFEPSGARP